MEKQITWSQLLLTIVLLAVGIALLISMPAHAGALTRVAAIGTGDVGVGADPEGPWLTGNLACRIQLHQGQFAELGAEAMLPKFKFRDNLGREWQSKDVAHVLPTLTIGKKYGDDTVIGLDIHTQYGLGAAFPAINYGMDTKSLLAGTTITPFVAHRLTDNLTLGLGLNLMMAQLSWDAPFDVSRVPLPLMTRTKASGFGAGATVALWYQPTDSFGIGVNYASPVKVEMDGHSRIMLPTGQIRDSIETSYQFPDKLDVGVGYKPADNWLITADFGYVGYSKSPNDISIKFDKLMFTKPVTLGWRDHILAHVGVSHNDEHWTIGLGAGYMSQSVPDKRVDILTPDINGVCVGGRIAYKASDNLDIAASLTRGWGENKTQSGEYKADIWTIGLSGTIKF